MAVDKFHGVVKMNIPTFHKINMGIFLCGSLNNPSNFKMTRYAATALAARSNASACASVPMVIRR